MQLPFIRAITETKELMHISIGKKISKAALDRTLHRMTEHSDRYNIVFLKNIEISTKPVSGRSDEQKKIDKIIRTASERDPLLYLFKKVLHTIDKEHEIIAYVNPKDF